MLDWNTDVRTILQEVITETPPQSPRSRLFGFAAASGSLVLVFIAAGTPIPLYTTYRLEDGLTHGDLAAAAAVYLIAAAFALLVLGRLSDHLGRRPVAVVALVLAAAGMGVLLTVDSAAPLLLGRTMQGLATGIATSTLGAYAIDTAPTRPHWLAAVTTSAAPMLGIPSGALLAGALVDHGPDPRHLTFSILLGALLLAAVAVSFGPETASPAPWREALDRAAASLRPRILVPQGAGRPLVAMAGVILATWSVGGFYQAFGPSITAVELGSSAALTAAAVFASFTVLNMLGGPLTSSWRPVTGLRVGAVVYLLLLAGILTSLAAGAILPFLLFSLAAGVAQGVAQTGGMRSLLPLTAPQERAGLVSTVYLLNYSSAAIPSLIAGQVSDTVSLVQIACSYGVLALLGVTMTLVVARSGR
ncbi:MFS transporter [Nesterenkonia sp. HG001]|uniref:MFS transporter n=1 Tax=Nesterenkonia sp. HG001 TaxID=2983207 RepID=UPI002AC38342|nr:MFS transporter [Nesterenkonia sp. HG001]MDZ5077758.1 MFS transporter [Nesterenkonia sp. HG001]